MATVVSKTEQKIAPKVYRGYIEVQYTHADLTDEDGSEDLTLPVQEGNSSPVGARLMVTEYIAGGSVSAATISIGRNGGGTALLGATNAFDTTTLGTWVYNTSGAADFGGGFSSSVFETSGTALCRVSTTGDDVDNTTAGEWVIGYWYDRVED